MKYAVIMSAAVAALAGCASTSVRDMSQDTFKLSTVTAPICGSNAAAETAYNNAAIEVIRRGGDRFVILSDQGGQEYGGTIYNPYAGIATPIVRGNQGLIVRTMGPDDEGYGKALSARRVLGPDWRKIVAKGPRKTC